MERIPVVLVFCESREFATPDNLKPFILVVTDSSLLSCLRLFVGRGTIVCIAPTLLLLTSSLTYVTLLSLLAGYVLLYTGPSTFQVVPVKICLSKKEFEFTRLFVGSVTYATLLVWVGASHSRKS